MTADLQRQLDLLHSELPQVVNDYDKYMKSRDCAGGNPFNLRWELRHIFKYSLLGVNADDSSLIADAYHPYDLMTSSDAAFFHAYLGEIFPNGYADLTQREIVLRVVRHVTEKLRNGMESPGLAKDIMEGGIANCGGRCSVAKEFLRYLGCPTRTVGMVFANTKHVGLEVHFDGSWHFVDALCGLYFCGADGDSSRMLSFSEWLNGGGGGGSRCVAFAPGVFSGKPDNGSLRHAIFTNDSVESVLEAFLADHGNKAAVAAIYRMYFGDPDSILSCAASPKSLLPCPLNLDFTVRDSIRVGKIDNTGNDVFYVGIADPASRSVPSGIGQNVAYTCFLSIIARSPGKGYMRLRIYAATGDVPELSITMLQNARLIDVTREGRIATLNIRLMDSVGAFLVTSWQYAALAAVEAEFRVCREECVETAALHRRGSRV